MFAGKNVMFFYQYTHQRYFLYYHPLQSAKRDSDSAFQSPAFNLVFYK